MMKRIMWIIAMIPTIVTAVVYQFLPKEMPMHYDVNGEIDRWGSRAEQFIFPAIILVMALFWQIMIILYEKGAQNEKNAEKERKEYVANAKVLGIVGIVQGVMFGIMHFIFLYGAWVEANTGATHMAIDVTKVVNILVGIVFIIFGNIMPKSKKNALVGARTGWSMYNDNTWRKTNRLGGIVLVVTGFLTIVTSVFVSGMVGTICMLAYLIAGTIVIVVYSKKVYDKEVKG